MLLPGEDPAAMGDETVRRLMRPFAAEGEVEIVRKAVYRFHGLVARDWRRGRVFPGGRRGAPDPPFAGQGMCSGLRDAANLAWKLGLVLKGKAGDALLDTYQSEREPHVRQVIELAIAMGRVVCERDPAKAAERDRTMIAARGRPASDAATPPQPGLAAGFLHPSPRAGDLVPQPRDEPGRRDAALGDGFCPADARPARRAAGHAALDVTALGDGGALAAWLWRCGSRARAPTAMSSAPARPICFWTGWPHRCSHARSFRRRQP